MKRFKKLPIAAQLWLLAIIIILIISSIFMTSYYMIYNNLIENNIVYTTQVLKQMQSNIKDKATLLESLLQNTGYKKNVFKYIKETKNANKIDQISELDNESLNVYQIEKNIEEVIIEGFNGTNYYSNGKTKNIADALQSVPETVQNHYDISQKLDYKNNGGLSFILSTSLYDIWKITGRNTSARISFIVNMNILGIKQFTDKYDMSLFLLDENHNICTANKPITKETEVVLEKIKPLKKVERLEIVANGTEYIINCDKVDSIGGFILSITPKKNITDNILWIKSITYYLLLLALFLILIMFTFFKHNITAPLKKFSSFMGEIENGNFSGLKKRVNLTGYKEIEEISNQFNNMIDEINSLTQRLVKTMGTLYEAELQKKQSELLYLKSQINPHFLYNTLEVILGMAFIEEAPQTAEMIKCLSKIFKYCIKGKDTVPVCEELNIIKSYVHIQQTRFFDMFDVIYEFDEQILYNQIPKMLLQPLIENAITHGIDEKGSKGIVHIGGKLGKDRETKLWVQDDGIGLDEDKLKHLKSIITQETALRTDCIGFENVINRLQLIYGENCEINITSEVNKGTRIEITIPGFHLEGAN